MKTGCNGPFLHGSGGWCGCNCKCCPPPCCPVIAVYFDCGAPQTADNPDGCVFSTPLWSVEVPPPAPFPEFSKKPIISDDSKYIFGAGVSNCSVPCETVCVELRCGGNDMPCCCLELLSGKIYSVGNGYVNANATVEVPGCQTATVLINGSPPPVFVCDGSEVIVTLTTENECCECQQIDVKCAPCDPCVTHTKFAFKRTKALWRRKIENGTTKMRAGRPVIGLDKNELVKRILARIKKLRRRK